MPVIAQEAGTGQVLMFAWMNRESLTLTAEEGYAVYWSRSRQKLWHKGEESGHRQKVLEIRLDCDEDVVLLKVEQAGGIACHTGRHHCFFRVVARRHVGGRGPGTESPRDHLPMTDGDILARLSEVLEQRKSAGSPEVSTWRVYTPRGWTPSSRRSVRRPPKR